MTHEQTSSLLTSTSGIAGVILYLAVGYIYLVSGLVVPLPALVVLWLVWIGGLFVLVNVWKSHRVWLPLVAVAAFAFWALFVSAGGAIFNWTA